MKTNRSGSKSYKIVFIPRVLVVVVISSLALLDITGFINQISFNNLPNRVDNRVTWAGKSIFQFVSGNSTVLTASSGSSISETITINFLENATIRFFVDDGVGGFNTSLPTLPNGISVTVIVDGHIYNAELYSQVGDLTTSRNQLIQVGPGTIMVRYTVSIASGIPKGLYQFNIVCANFLNQGTLLNQIQDLEVVLNVA